MNSKAASKRRLWLFWFIAVIIIPSLVIVCIETGLRVFNYGYDTDITVRSSQMGQDAYRANRHFTWPYFSPELARPIMPFAIPAGKKPPDTYRIFVLGASAAEGYPAHYVSFSRILEQMLIHRFPGVKFEVINAAITAINSHVVLEIAKDLSEFEGDLFIVYLGNNEVVGPYGPGTVLAPFQQNLSLIRFSSFLNSTRMGQLMKNVVSAITGSRHEFPREWKGMELFTQNQIRADDPRMNHVYRHFQRNLEDIINVARKGEAKVVVSTVGSNLKDLGPFGSPNGEDLNTDWKMFFQEGVRHQEAGNCAAAVRNYVRAEKIDPHHADLHFRLGSCYYSSGRYDLAKEEFVKARDLDTLRFRADTGINEVIRNVVRDKADHDVLLLDAVKVFDEQSPGSIAGKELFYEHVHLRFEGNYLLAQAIFEKIRPELPAWVKKEEVAEREDLSLDDAMMLLAYTGYNRISTISNVLKVITHAPFTNVSNHQELVDEISRENEKLRSLYQSTEGLRMAVAQHKNALKYNPDDKWIHYYLGIIYVYLGEHEKAADSFRMAVMQMPDHAMANNMLKSALKKQGYNR
jgi:tetratricopeptide (TPR) repeat protein